MHMTTAFGAGGKKGGGAAWAKHARNWCETRKKVSLGRSKKEEAMRGKKRGMFEIQCGPVVNYGPHGAARCG
jgi:hypothetical protein